MMFLLLLLSFAVSTTNAAYSAPLQRRHIAGVWKLRGIPSLMTRAKMRFPMKEFTTYPKKPSPPPEEHLLMLKEDGSFLQYDEEEQQQPQHKKSNSILNGSWDFVDGRLILAADKRDKGGNKKNNPYPNTILEGRVVAKEQESLTEAKQVVDKNQQQNTPPQPQEPKQAATDTHLSVPQGAVKVGKFMYPKKHPSFFEQPMFKPLSTGSFELSQVLGSLNAAVEQEEELIERFTKSDFADRKFLLTNYPIPERVPKGELRWSIKQNKFVRDPVKQKKQDKEDEEKTVPIRVMEVMLFANNTFCTTAGLGDATVLRGKWSVIGDERDQFYMQVWRFGFGRSVSGSTFSEGPTLTQDDAKAYWGRINYVDEDDNDEIGGGNFQKSQSKPAAEGEAPRRIQVKGSVIVGLGLEPQPCGRFIMREELNQEEEEDDDEDYEDDDDDDDYDELLNFKMPKDPNPDEDIDWSSSFQ